MKLTPFDKYILKQIVMLLFFVLVIALIAIFVLVLSFIFSQLMNQFR
jgi:hypothetical protein